MWFAAMESPEEYPWTRFLVWKLLHNDAGALSLFAGNPFRGSPPRYVRAVLYKYSLAQSGKGEWWRRERLGLWLPPASVNDEHFIDILKSGGWVR
jgi:hypothetical protein